VEEEMQKEEEKKEDTAIPDAVITERLMPYKIFTATK
jgi:hypothetical protein